MNKSRFITCSALAFFAATGAASAQTGAESTAGIKPDAQTSGLEEIVVTAQKRSERLQDVPVAVTALTSAKLQVSGITDTKSLSVVTPALNFGQTSAFAQPYIRGVGSRGNTPGDEQVVPIYIDGVYQVGLTAGLFKLNSVERIEVLKGPQGTLFGRNALGGAINIVTRAPSFTPKMELGGGYGSFAEVKGDVYATGGLSDTVAASISLAGSHDHGYAKDIFADHRASRASSKDARGKILWKPADAFEATLGAHYTRTRDNTGNSDYVFGGSTAARARNPNVLITSGYTLARDVQSDATTRSWGTDLTAIYSHPGFTVTSISSYNKFRSRFISDNDATPVFISAFEAKQSYKTFTQELRAASDGDGPLKWIFGGYYFHDNIDVPLFANYPTSFSAATQKTRAIALFGEVGYDITSKLSILGGLRYSHERRRMNSINLVNNQTFADSISFNDLSPRATLRYSINDKQQLYATYSTGFKAGIFVIPVPGATIQKVDPEKLKSYEIGYKGDMTSWARLNVAGYYYNYTDVQVASFVQIGVSPTGVPITAALLQNAATVRIYGGEAELSLAPTRDWSIDLSAAYSHATYKDYKNAAVSVPIVNASGVPTLTGNRTVFLDVSGNQVLRAPKFTAGINTTYTLPTPVFGGSLRGNLTAYYSSGYPFDVIGRIETGSYETVNARLTWLSPSEQFQLSAWVTNLTDDDHIISVSESAVADRATRTRPRSFGVDFRLYFGG